MFRKLKILCVVAGLPAEGGGFSEVVPAISAALVRQGAEVTLATRAGTDVSNATLEAEAHGVTLVRFRPSFPGRIYFSWQMLSGLGRLVREADVVYLHGHWTFPIWWAGRCALRQHKTLVMRPAGSLNPVQLAHSAFAKKLASFFDYALLRRADAIHVSSEAERDWTLQVPGLRERANRIFIVPNGVSVPDYLRNSEAGMTAFESRTLLYLGRIHPMKGLDLLLEAVKIHKDVSGEASKGASDVRKIRLVICGPDEEGTLERLKSQVEELGLTDEVEFREPVRGAAKWELIKTCDGLVLPSRSENFGLVVAEALACGKPVICTQGAPWEALEREGMGWWTPILAEGLASAIGKFSACSDTELAAIGRRGSLYAVHNLSWDTAASSILCEIQSRMK